MKTKALKIETYSGHVEIQDDKKETFAMLNFGESGGYPDEKAATDAAKFLIHGPELLDQLQSTIEKYGKSGGPWNVPSEPGEWISNARKLLKLFTNK
jgi:hypothetical protein